MLIAVSGLAGVLVAGLAIPVAALTGVMSQVVSTSLEELPLYLETPPQAQRTTVYYSNGEKMAEFYDENRTIVTLDQIAPIMQQAQVAIEDDRFYHHGALDFRALAKAVLSYFGRSDGGGGSTLTQQYVKQVIMEDAAKIMKEDERQEALEAAQERTIRRKVQEMRHAIAVENKFSKDEILERYLNIAYYGAGAYGVEAAAHRYFDTTAAELTLAQAALLAGIVQTPSRNPVDNLAGALERRNTVLDRMAELEIITKAEAKEAKAEIFDTGLIQNVRNGCVGVPHSQVCRLVWNYLMTNEALGKNKMERENMVKRGGFDIKTTINPEIQNSTQAAISARIHPQDPVLAAIIIIEPGKGRIVAAAQNRYEFGMDEAAGQTNYLSFALPELGGDEGGQPGSTFKMLTAAAALEAGIPPTKKFDAKARMNFRGQVFRSCSGPFKLGDWNVRNVSPSGPMDMYQAAMQSVNTYFVLLEQMVGICNVVEMAEKVGVVATKGPDYPEGLRSYDGTASLTLGTLLTSPMSMATAYATFASGGIRCNPIVIESITDKEGKEYSTQQPNCERVVSEDVANAINLIFNKVFTSGGTASCCGVRDGRPASGKTGTTDNGEAAWLIGYTPEVVGVSMIRVDKNPKWDYFWDPRRNSMTGVRLPASGTVLAGYGGPDAGRMWKTAMDSAIGWYPATRFKPPGGSVLTGKATTPPNTDGMSDVAARQVLEAAGFFIITTDVYHDSQAGTFLGAKCERVLGGSCTFTYSMGPRPS
jgi:membrane peptidoglycan carboxypeptidase